jgi:hypothetical protein
MANILGTQTLDSVLILLVDANPAISGGTPAPSGSFATVVGGLGFYLKTGALDTDWTILDTEPVATKNTTDATPTPLKTIAVPNNSAILISSNISCRKTAGAGVGTIGGANGYIRTVIAKNVAGVVTLGIIQTAYTSEDIPEFDTTFVVSGTNVIVQVTGSLNDDVSWSGVIKTTSV